MRNFQLFLIAIISIFSLPFVNAQVTNPILPGFYPDPSICRVDNDYYLVNSSFSFFPGVPVFHSTDLVHWQQIGHVLNRPSQLELINNPISRGIWAPTIRFKDGVFYVITTLMGKGGKNFFVTATNPVGPWSEPHWLPEIDGIDPSFFFDEDGKAYIINNGPVADGKPLYNGHRSLWLQEFDQASQKPVGKRVEIVNGGTDITKKPIWIEGPHLFNKNGYYYLLAAEGGTGLGHSQVIFRSKSIWGPYEAFDGNPIMTQRDLPADRPNPLTCTGHADFVQTPAGDWVSVFLACLPYDEDSYFNTGRQTFIHPVDWSGEWPVIIENGKAVPFNVSLPGTVAKGKLTFADYSANWKDDFVQPELKQEWNFIRTPQTKWYELKNNSLILEARPVSISDVGNPSFVGRRLQHINAEMTTAVKLENGKEMEAGLVAFQNEKFFYKLVVLHASGKYYLVLSSASGEIEKTELAGYKAGKKIYMRMLALGNEFKCGYSLNNKTWVSFGETLDGKHLSTKVAGGFVGAYFGLYAFSEIQGKAYFDWATYKKTK